MQFLAGRSLVSILNITTTEREMTTLSATLPFSFSGLCFRLYENLYVTHWTLAKPTRSLGSTCYVVSSPFRASWSSLSSNKHKQCLALQCVHSDLHTAEPLPSFTSLIEHKQLEVTRHTSLVAGPGSPRSEPAPRPTKASSKLHYERVFLKQFQLLLELLLV